VLLYVHNKKLYIKNSSLYTILPLMPPKIKSPPSTFVLHNNKFVCSVRRFDFCKEMLFRSCNKFIRNTQLVHVLTKGTFVFGFLDFKKIEFIRAN